MTDRPIIFSAPMVRALLDGRKTMTRRMAWCWSGQNKVKPLPDGGYFVALQRDSGASLVASHWQNVTVGDRLWIREVMTYWERPDPPKDYLHPRANESSSPQDGKRYERWMSRVMSHDLPGEDFIVYKADDAKCSIGAWKFPHPVYEHCVGRFNKTIAAIHMPRWASRLTLIVTAKKIERVQEISEDDAKAEGMEPFGIGYRAWEGCPHVLHARHAFQDCWRDLHGPDAWDANSEVIAMTFTIHKQNIDAMEKAA